MKCDRKHTPIVSQKQKRAFYYWKEHLESRPKSLKLSDIRSHLKEVEHRKLPNVALIIFPIIFLLTFSFITTTVTAITIELSNAENIVDGRVRDLANTRYGGQIKWDISGIAAGQTIESATACGWLWDSSGTLSPNIKIYRIEDQVWTSAYDAAAVNAQTKGLSVSTTLNSTSTNSWGCFDVTNIIAADYAVSNTYSTIRWESTEYPLVTISSVGWTQELEIGASGAYSAINSEENQAGNGKTPKLFITHKAINGLNLTIKNYNNSIINDWGIESTNSSHTIYLSGYLSPSYIPFKDLTSGTSNVTITHPLFKNITINDINIYDDMGILNYTLYTYRAQQWTLQGGGASVNGTMTISNTTHSYNFNLEPTVQLYIYELPIGDVTAIFSAPNFISLTEYYTIDFDSEITKIINLMNSGIILKVWNEDSRESITMYQVSLTNQTVTKKLIAGKTSTFSFLDDSHSTGVSGNNNINYTYAFGYNNGNFSISHNVGSSSNMNISIYDPITETFSILYSKSTSTGGNLTSYFNVSNEINRYGDYPLFRLQTEGTVSVYDISLTYPYSYNSLGHMMVNYTNFGITSGDTRFIISSDIYPQRTYFASPTAYSQTELNAYLTNLCFYKSFSVLQSGTMQTEQISDALITVYRQFDYSSEIIAQEKSNAVGTLSICVQPAYPYSITASATGYNTVTATSQTFFNDGQLVTIYLSQTSFNLTYNSPFSGILHQLTPNELYFSNDTSIQFSCQGYSANNSLISLKFNVNHTDIYSSDLDRLRASDYPPSYNFTLSNINKINVLNSNLTSSTGGFLNYTAIDIGRYDMGCTIEFTTDEFGIVQYTILRTTFFYSNTHGIINIGKDTNITELVSKETFQLISLFITMIVSGFFVKYFGVKSGFIFLVILGFQLVLFASWGMPITTFGIYIIAILIWLAIILMGIL